MSVLKPTSMPATSVMAFNGSGVPLKGTPRLDMKRAQNPAPYAWVIDANTSPRTFDHYRQQYEQMFEEASIVYSRY
jgi:hypothetical protein